MQFGDLVLVRVRFCTHSSWPTSLGPNLALRLPPAPSSTEFIPSTPQSGVHLQWVFSPFNAVSI